MWSVSLELLLLVVLGGRSVISGAVIAGAVTAVQALPIPNEVEKIIPLTIALGVIGLAQEPEGTARMTVRQTLHVLTVLRPLPKRRSGSPTPVPTPVPVPMAVVERAG
jgi:ABC-type branched-subunit amino acid transport system permease subunit